MHYTAHYADLEHEIKPVTSGYRLALVYSLCSGQKIDDMIQSYKTTETFKDCLNKLSELKKPFAISLDHQYTHESLSNSGALALKGVDTERYNFLRAASMRLSNDNQLCFCIVKANLKIEQTGPDDYESSSSRKQNFWGNRSYYKDSAKAKLTAVEEEEYETDDDEGNSKCKTIDNWYDLDGKPILDDRFQVSVDFFSKIFDISNESEEDKINSWMLVDHDVDYTGNAGTTITTKYDKYLLAFWPKKLQFKIMSKFSTDKAIDSLQDETNSEIKLKNLEHLLNKLNGNEIIEISDNDNDNNDDDDDDLNTINDFSLKYRSYRSNGSKMNSQSYSKLIHLLKSVQKPLLTKLFIEMIRPKETESPVGENIFLQWKKENMEVTIFRQILTDLIVNSEVISLKNIENFFTTNVNAKTIEQNCCVAQVRLSKYFFL